MNVAGSKFLLSKRSRAPPLFSHLISGFGFDVASFKSDFDPSFSSVSLYVSLSMFLFWVKRSLFGVSVRKCYVNEGGLLLPPPPPRGAKPKPPRPLPSGPRGDLTGSTTLVCSSEFDRLVNVSGLGV